MADYDASMQAGARSRKEGRLADAERHFEVAAAASPAGSPAQAMATYFLGLTRQDRDDDEAALAPLADALRVYEREQAGSWSAALAGAALGLSLLRLQRWSEAARVIEQANARMGGEAENPKALAAGLHNLALAYTRGGDPQRGLDTARAALGVRTRLNGPYHPLTVETQLVEAYAQLETGDLDAAGVLIRRAAKLVLAGPGEAHAIFADALLTEARRVARLGDGCAAEALARRALFILKQSNADAGSLKQRQHDAAALGRLWRTAPKASDVSDVALWRVAMQITLRGYQVKTLDFAPAPPRPKEWYFFVPASWPLSWALYAARLTFAGANQFLNSREPADANFMDAVSAEAVLPGERELLAANFAEAFRSRVWESSIAYTLVQGDLSLPLTQAAFAVALAAFGVPDSLLTPLGVDSAALAAARADRRGTLLAVLF